MTNLARAVVALDGWIGGPGVNVLHFSEGFAPPFDEDSIQGTADELHTAYSACADMLAPGVTITIPAAFPIFDVDTGEIVDVISVPEPVDVITSTGTSGSTSRAAQICVRLSTSKFINGRRLQGRFFFGPIGGGLLQSDGQVSPTMQNNFTDAFGGMTSGIGTRLAVWHRPKGNPHADPPVPPTGGDWADVISVKGSPTPGTLRSRVT